MFKIFTDRHINLEIFGVGNFFEKKLAGDAYYGPESTSFAKHSILYVWLALSTWYEELRDPRFQIRSSPLQFRSSFRPLHSTYDSLKQS